jgi:hypothetical protein
VCRRSIGVVGIGDLGDAELKVNASQFQPGLVVGLRGGNSQARDLHCLTAPRRQVLEVFGKPILVSDGDIDQLGQPGGWHNGQGAGRLQADDVPLTV